MTISAADSGPGHNTKHAPGIFNLPFQHFKSSGFFPDKPKSAIIAITRLTNAF
jgi:hypothetical protein